MFERITIRRQVIAATLLLLPFLLPLRSTDAALRSWQDNGDNPDWGFALNWSPIGTPTATDNIVLGSLAAEDTVVNQDFTIDTLAITNGATVDTDNHQLDVSGDIILSESGSKITVQDPTGPNPIGLLADDITLLTGTTLEVVNSTVSLSGAMSIRAGAEVFGHGRITANRLLNAGTLAANSPVRLFLNTTLPVDLDGSNENGSLSAINGSIVIESPLADPFDGMITVGSAQQVEFLFDDTTIGSGAVVHLQGSGGTAASFGSFFQGSVNVDFEGTLNVDQAGRLGNLRFLNGSVANLTNNARLEMRMTASTIEAGATITGSGHIAIEDGTLTLADGAQVAVSIESNSGSPGGTLRIGDGIATAEILAYETDGGRLDIELGGSKFHEYDRLTVSSSAVLNSGELNVSLINGFVPSAGKSFQIISTLGSIIGQFDTTADQLPALLGGLTWEIDYSDPSHVFLRVNEPNPADFDLDGDVDLADLLHPVTGWQGRYGNDLDGADFLTWQREFGFGTSSLASSQTVPEPTTCAICLTLLSCCLARPRGSRT